MHVYLLPQSWKNSSSKSEQNTEESSIVTLLECIHHDQKLALAVREEKIKDVTSVARRASANAQAPLSPIVFL